MIILTLIFALIAYVFIMLIVYLVLSYPLLYLYILPTIVQGYRSAFQSAIQSTTSFDQRNWKECWVRGLVLCYALEPFIAPFWLVLVLSRVDFAPDHHLLTTLIGVLPLVLVHLLARATNFWLMRVLLQFALPRISLAIITVFLTTYIASHPYLVTFANVIPVVLSAYLLKETMTELHDELQFMTRERQRIDQPHSPEHSVSQ